MGWARSVKAKWFRDRKMVFCHWCGHELFEQARSGIEKRRPWACTIDHLIEKSKGGGNNPENLVPSCQPCNTTRSNARKPTHSAGNRGSK